MKRLLLILLFFIFSTSLFSQYYIKGDVKDSSGTALQNVKIIDNSTNLIYRSGIYGGFGIITSRLIDSLTFSLDGYETVKVKIKATEYLKIHLKALIALTKNQVSHLNNFVKQSDDNTNWTIDNESYTTLVENSFVKTSPSYPIIFASNTNQASYSNIRRFLSAGEKVPPDALQPL